jgi:hypothetical protein
MTEEEEEKQYSDPQVPVKEVRCRDNTFACIREVPGLNVGLSEVFPVSSQPFHENTSMVP